MIRWKACIAACATVCLTGALAAGHAPASWFDLGPDRTVAGGSVTQSAPVAGDLLGAGGRIEVAGAVGGDALLTGGEVRVRAPVAQSVYAAGGRVSVDAPVQRNVRATGGSVEIGPGARISGNVAVAAGELRVLAPVTGYLGAAAGRIYIDAPVGGDVEVSAGRVELGPRAAIGGSVRYASGSELVRDPAARVAGTIERREAVPRAAPPQHGSGGGHWLWTIGLMLPAALLAASAPVGYARTVETLRARPAASALVGFVALVCIPIVAVILLATLVGAPLALLMLLAYPALLIVGYVSVAVALGAIALGRWKPEVAQRPGWRALFAAGAVLAIGVLTSVPWVGTLAALLILVTGTGALLMNLRQTLPRPRAPA